MCRYSPDASILAAGTTRGTLYIYNADQDYKLITVLTEHTGLVTFRTDIKKTLTLMIPELLGSTFSYYFQFKFLLKTQTGLNHAHLTLFRRSHGTPQWNHAINQAAFVCLSVCLFVPYPLRGPLTDLRQTWWVYVGGPRNCPWRVLFQKGQRVDGSTGHFHFPLYYICTSLTPHSCKRRLLLCGC